MQDKNVIKLNDQDAALLEQGASMLEGLENDERNRGNCSTAEGAGCSAHAVRRLASALLAHEREIGQCLHQITEPQAAPAAVAVPDGWKLVPTEPTPQMCHVGRYGGDKDAPAYGEKPVEGETAWPFVADHTAKQIYCAMLAAAPALAATPAAAPVVLPEPAHWLAVLDPEQVPHQLKTSLHAVGFRNKKSAEAFIAEQLDFSGWRYTLESLFKEQQLRALLATAPLQPVEGPTNDQATWCSYIAGMIGCYLNEPDDSPRVKAIAGIIERRLWALPSAATATGLPAQAVPAFCHVASLKLKSMQERGYQITGYALEKPVEGEQPERGFINHGGFVGWWWDGQSPQAQADARDAGKLQFLMEADQHLLHRFIETTEDDESYDLKKEEIKRLAELGVVSNHGFGRYSVTMFGYWAHEQFWHQNPSLPLKTNSDRDREHRAAIAAQAAQGSEA
ncbi:hypothetical protein [Comamonas sp. C11]|uniref:hypothetical protein n=1 Tax=Comamonas sp. C11 TaxID=2966554 RepID=UPI0021113FC2|nr:hypothetical protein [Comamonas sp. C11]UUC92497.1 hypothetical protein NOX35_19745 [Comamonas sp. C11]UUC92549.1 hypothetical protein NOX35_20015 [Comamonas sp. C11]